LFLREIDFYFVAFERKDKMKFAVLIVQTRSNFSTRPTKWELLFS